MSRINTVGHPVGKLHRMQLRPERLWPNVVDSNLLGTSVTVTSPAALNTMTGAVWVEVIASTSGHVDWVAIWLSNTAVSAANTSSLVDIGIGAAASETVIVSGLPAGYHSNKTTAYPVPGCCMIPVTIPKGTRIAVRMQSAVTLKTAIVHMETYFQGLRCGSVVDTIGADTASSRGTNMPTTNVYAELIAATAQPYQALVMVAPFSTAATTAATVTYTLGAGAAAAETALLTAAVTTNNGEEGKIDLRQGVIYSGHVPAGTRIAGKQSTGHASRDMIVLGVRY